MELPHHQPKPETPYTPPAGGGINHEILKAKIIEVLQTCYDPEIPVNIYELGMVYDIALNEANKLTIQMTLTSPNCPAIETLPAEIQHKVSTVEGVSSATIDLVWDPPWTPDKMSEAAKLQLGMF
jgi:FeS assembly SUF system protein